MTDEPSLYDRAGGTPFFEQLVDRFYMHVAERPRLLALYPEPDDLSGARWRLTHFLVQYWGGPTIYGDQRGHPRLRMRHHPYLVDAAARDDWLGAMAAAIDDVDPAPDVRGPLWQYVVNAAEAMRNA